MQTPPPLKALLMIPWNPVHPLTQNSQLALFGSTFFFQFLPLSDLLNNVLIIHIFGTSTGIEYKPPQGHEFLFDIQGMEQGVASSSYVFVKSVFVK